MAEKWDESAANDSPEVVYEGFSSPAPHPQGQGMMQAGGSFVAAPDGSVAGNEMGGSAANYMPPQPMMENQVIEQSDVTLASIFEME